MDYKQAMEYKRKQLEAADKYNKGFENARDRVNGKIRRDAAKLRYQPSEQRGYDPTMHLAQEMIHVAHSGNHVKVQLIKNIDNGSKHYGDKTLLGYTDKHHHLLVMELPLNDAQYQTVKQNARTW